MRILIVSTFFPPLNSIASLRPYSWAKYWTKAGHDVTVLTTEKQCDPKTALSLPNPGYRVIELPLPKFLRKMKGEYNAANASGAKKGALRRLFDYLRYKRGIFNACRMPDFTDLWIRPAIRAAAGRKPWDLVVSSSGPYSVHIVADALKRRGLAKKWAADCRDSWSDNHIYPGIFPLSLLEKRWEERLLRRADAIATISASFGEALGKRFGPEKVHTVENGFDPEDLKALPDAAVFPRDGKFRIVHTGSLYFGKQNFIPVLEALRELQDPSLELIFAGTGNGDLPALIRQYGVENRVVVKGLVPREEALRMQRDADALLFLPWNDASVDGVLTGKIFEYLFSGTEIMAVGAKKQEASQKLILDSHAGVLLPDSASVKEYLVKKRSRKRQVPAELHSRYGRKALAERFLEAVS